MKVDTINAMCTVTHICFCFIRLTRCIHFVIRKTVNFLWNSFISSNFVKNVKTTKRRQQNYRLFFPSTSLTHFVVHSVGTMIRNFKFPAMYVNIKTISKRKNL